MFRKVYLKPLNKVFKRLVIVLVSHHRALASEDVVVEGQCDLRWLDFLSIFGN